MHSGVMTKWKKFIAGDGKYLQKKFNKPLTLKLWNKLNQGC